MRKETRLDQAEVLQNGCVQVRLKKLLINDDGSEAILDVGGQYHRFIVEPGNLVTRAHRDAINDALKGMGCGEIPNEDFDYVVLICAAAHTTNKVAAFKAQQAKARDAAKLALGIE